MSHFSSLLCEAAAVKAVWEPCGNHLEGNNYVLLIINPIRFFFRADAAEVLRANRRLFEQNVQKAMRGGYVGSVYFERCLVK